jgi:glutathione S-transferase
MSGKITFYHNPMSRGRMAHWMLEEVGVPYETKVLDFEKREHKAPSYLAINPMGKIPAIVHDGVVITETPAIIAYLADRFPEKKLAPRLDDPARGTYLRWMFFGAGCVEPAIMDKMLGRGSGDRPGSIGYGTFEDTMNVVEEAVSKTPYLLGDEFSAADLYISSQIGFGMMVKAVEPRPAFVAYLERTQDRPAAKAAGQAGNRIIEEMKMAKK